MKAWRIFLSVMIVLQTIILVGLLTSCGAKDLGVSAVPGAIINEMPDPEPSDDPEPEPTIEPSGCTLQCPANFKAFEMAPFHYKCLKTLKVKKAKGE